MILKLSTIPELRADALRTMAVLRGAGLSVEDGADTVAGNGNGAGDHHQRVRVLPLLHLEAEEPATAVLRREEPGDVLLSRGPVTFSLRTLPPGARVGLAGARRKAYLRAHRKDLEPVALENGQTPAEAFTAGTVDFAILGAAEARGAGLEAHVAEFQDPKAWLPGPQQGAVAVVVENGSSGAVHGALEHGPTRAAVICEGALADGLNGWRAPLGALAQPSGPWLRLWAMLASPDGTRVVRGDLTGQASEPEALAELMAEYLRARGAEDVMQS